MFYLSSDRAGYKQYEFRKEADRTYEDLWFKLLVHLLAQLPVNIHSQTQYLCMPTEKCTHGPYSRQESESLC